MIAAARIQRMTRLFDAHIIAGEETFGRSKGCVQNRELGTPRLKGIKQRADAVRDLGCATPATRSSTPAQSRRGPSGRPTVLIVDDEPRVLDALEAILAAEFRVLRAG